MPHQVSTGAFHLTISQNCTPFNWNQGSFHGSQIPLEPVYLLLNTAVSATWGFPPCGTACDCTCFDARDPACECAIDPGLYSLFPAEFVIDSVSTPVPTVMYVLAHR